MRAASLVALVAVATLPPSLHSLDAQSTTPHAPAEIRITRRPDGGALVFSSSANRAVLGVSLGATSAADTAGVAIADVRADGPAAKAGLKAGDVITDINGISLRVSRADASDPELAGVGERRLLRALAKAKPGDEVELRVQTGAASRVAKVTLVSAAELDGGPRGRLGDLRSGRAGRPAIGVTLVASGSMRDTLGLFIASVASKGPAESAGVVEGERISAINGVDVRVPREDVEDPSAASARVHRFVREVQKGEAGATVTLRVFGGGRFRDVAVKTTASLPSDDFEIPGVLFRTRPGDGARVLEFGAPGRELRLDGDGVPMLREGLERALDNMRRGIQDAGRDMRHLLGRDSVLGTPTVRRTVIRRTVTAL